VILVLSYVISLALVKSLGQIIALRVYSRSGTDTTYPPVSGVRMIGYAFINRQNEKSARKFWGLDNSSSMILGGYRCVMCFQF
jgi:hypothetical protein